jgi:hypothetical protein
MVHCNEHIPDPPGPLLPGLEEEMLEITRKKYGKQAAEALARECESFRAVLVPFVLTLARYSDDPDIQDAIGRSYREFGRILRVNSKKPVNAGFFPDTLDEISRSILFTISANGYASLDDLSRTLHATHFDVLQRLRDVINPESMRRFGIPVAVFKESKTDPLTGEKILFSWWLNDEFLTETGQVEVTEDEEHVFVTVDLAGSDLPRCMRASATCNHGILEVQVKKGGIPHGRRSKRTG